MLRSILLLCFALSLGHIALAQSNLKLKPREIHRLAKVDLVMEDGKHVPRSWLYRVNRSDIQIVSKSYHNYSYDAVYFTGKVPLEDIKTITIMSRQRRFRTNLVGALIGGVAGYVVGHTLRAEAHQSERIEVLNQKTFSGVVEPFIGVIIGASVGVAIGDLFTPVTLDVNVNERRASRMLREISRKGKKKSRR